MSTKLVGRIFLFFLGIVVFMIQSQADPASVVQKPVLAIQHWQTPQGTDVYFVPTQQLPILDIQVMFNAGAARDVNQFGVANFTNALLDEGAGALTADQVAEQFDKVGAVYSAAASRDLASVGLRSLTDPQFLEPALKTFVTVLTAPQFSPAAVERVRKQIISGIQEQQQMPAEIARNAFLHTLYGNQPYGHNTLGTLESITAIQREDLLHFYQNYYVAKNAQIIMVGDVSTEKAKAIAEQITHSLSMGQAAPVIADVTVAPNKAAPQNISYPSQQTTALLGQISISPQDPDYIPLYVGNYTLGGDALLSELSLQVRSQQGWAYSIVSQFSPLQGKGPFLVFLQTRNTEAQHAIDLTQKILANFVQQGPTEQQLTAAKQNIIGSFPLGLTSNADILGQLAYMVFYHLPMDYLDTYRAKVNAVTAEQIREVFQRHINPDAMAVVTVGGMATPAPATINTANNKP